LEHIKFKDMNLLL